MIVPAGGGRTVFVLPWLGRTLVGTTDNDYEGSLDHVPASRRRHRLPAGGGQRVLRHHGSAPERPDRRLRGRAAADLHGRPEEVGGHLAQGRAVRDQLRARDDHRRQAHHLAADGQVGRRPDRRARGARGALPHRTRSRSASPRTRPRCRRCREWTSSSRAHLAARYGHAARDVLRLAAAAPQLAERISPELPDIAAEAAFAAGHEQARSLADVLLRRTRLGLLDARAPGDARLRGRPARGAGDGRRAGLGRRRGSSRSCATGARWRASRGSCRRSAAPVAEPAAQEAAPAGRRRARGGRMSAPLLMGIVNATPDSFSDRQGEKTLRGRSSSARTSWPRPARRSSTSAASPGRTDRAGRAGRGGARAGGAADRAAGGGRACGCRSTPGARRWRGRRSPRARRWSTT